MRIRILDRILVAMAGLLLVATCAGLVAQVFFGKNVVDFVTRVLQPETTLGKAVAGAVALILLILGLYCLLVLFRHRRRKDKFILQKLESGELAISLKTLEAMVTKCIEQHNEITTESIHLENQRDGLLIRIRGTVASGISIPLTVDTLQKQIKQYVTACSGVEVKGIRIQIESSGAEAKDAPFAIDPPSSNLLSKGEDNAEAVSGAAVTDIHEASVDTGSKESNEADRPLQGGEAAAAAAMAAAEVLMNEIETDDDRPIHQRLFSMQEEPCIMPLPPENLTESIPEASLPEEEKPEQTNKEETEVQEIAKEKENIAYLQEPNEADVQKGEENT